MANSLTDKDIKWVLAHLEAESDTDLFPRSFELTILGMHETEVIDAIQKIDLAQGGPISPRKPFYSAWGRRAHPAPRAGCLQLRSRRPCKQR